MSQHPDFSLVRGRVRQDFTDRGHRDAGYLGRLVFIQPGAMKLIDGQQHSGRVALALTDIEIFLLCCLSIVMIVGVHRLGHGAVGETTADISPKAHQPDDGPDIVALIICFEIAACAEIEGFFHG